MWLSSITIIIVSLLGFVASQNSTLVSVGFNYVGSLDTSIIVQSGNDNVNVEIVMNQLNVTLPSNEIGCLANFSTTNNTSPSSSSTASEGLSSSSQIQSSSLSSSTSSQFSSSSLQSSSSNTNLPSSSLTTQSSSQLSSSKFSSSSFQSSSQLSSSIIQSSSVGITSSSSSSSSNSPTPLTTPTTLVGYYANSDFSISKVSPFSITFNNDSTVKYGFYVDSINGNDQNSGLSPSNSLKSLQVASNRVSYLISQDILLTDNIVVYLNNSFYMPNTTWTIPIMSSIVTNHFVIYTSVNPSTPATISGGMVLSSTNWTLYNATTNVYVLPLPSLNFVTRGLFVNGVRAEKIRTQLLYNVSTITIPGSGGVLTGPGWIDCTQCGLPHTTIPTQVEFGWSGGFQFARCQGMLYPNASILLLGNCATLFASAFEFYLTSPIQFIENMVALFEPNSVGGFWAIDATYIYYQPRTNENLTTSFIVASQNENLLTALSITNHAFTNLIFSHTEFNQASNPQTGVFFLIRETLYTSVPNDNIVAPSGITMQGNNLFFSHCIFSQMTGSALEINNNINFQSSNNILLWKNQFHDISLTGFLLVNTYNPVTSLIVEDNQFTNLGVEYYTGCGMDLQYVQLSSIHYNTFSHIAYDGSSTSGGDFGTGPLSFNNTFYNNFCYNTMSKISDGAALYWGWLQPNTRIGQNYMNVIGNFGNTEVLSSHNGAVGLYFDEGCDNITLEQSNVIQNVAYFPTYRLENFQPGGTYVFFPAPSWLLFVDPTSLNNSVIMLSGARQPNIRLYPDQHLLFGGMYSTSTLNPITSTNSCAIGYTAELILGNNVTYCYQISLATPTTTFGGLYSNSHVNPLINVSSCPSGFSTSAILVDLFLCYKTYASNDPMFGGLIGQGIDTTVEKWVYYPHAITQSWYCPQDFNISSWVYSNGFNLFMCSNSTTIYSLSSSSTSIPASSSVISSSVFSSSSSSSSSNTNGPFLYVPINTVVNAPFSLGTITQSGTSVSVNIINSTGPDTAGIIPASNTYSLQYLYLANNPITAFTTFTATCTDLLSLCGISMVFGSSTINQSSLNSTYYGINFLQAGSNYAFAFYPLAQEIFINVVAGVPVTLQIQQFGTLICSGYLIPPVTYFVTLSCDEIPSAYQQVNYGVTGQNVGHSTYQGVSLVTTPQMVGNKGFLPSSTITTNLSTLNSGGYVLSNDNKTLYILGSGDFTPTPAGPYAFQFVGFPILTSTNFNVTTSCTVTSSFNAYCGIVFLNISTTLTSPLPSTSFLGWIIYTGNNGQVNNELGYTGVFRSNIFQISIQRLGSTFSFYYTISTDPTTWTLGYSETRSVSEAGFLGFYTTSNFDGRYMMGTFTNTSIQLF